LKKNILIGGEAGQGLQTIASILGKTLFREGYEIFTTKNYMSRVRGGHNFIKIRFGDEEITASENKLDLIVALNQETIDEHKEDLKKNGIILAETEVDKVESIKIDATEIAADINPKGKNTVFIGAVLKYFGLELNKCKNVIKENFSKKEEVVEDNHKLLKAGYDAIETKEKCVEVAENDKRIYIDGNTAVGYGAVSAGIKYYSAYPMSPSTGIMNYIAGKQDELGLVVEQAEDEIAAINMALGASYGGIRAMTGTSGGGFALMAEAVGLAGITETPLVIAEVQRPGPATGLPTRTEQGDLLFAVNVSQGEFPLMVMAPRDHEDAFYQTFRAHNLAEKYQIPVVILSDQYLADSTVSIPEYDFSDLEINRHLVQEKSGESEEYNRYEVTEDGISPRAYPGLLEGEVVLADSDEHDKHGYIVEDGNKRIEMADKRMKKLDKLISEDLLEPEYYGEKEIDYLFLSWGSTYGVLKETIDLLNEDGIDAGVLSFNDIWPLPQKELEKWVDKDIELIDVENNSTAQFAKLLRSETSIEVDNKILKYDGRPFTADEVYNRFKSEVK